MAIGASASMAPQAGCAVCGAGIELPLVFDPATARTSFDTRALVAHQRMHASCSCHWGDRCITRCDPFCAVHRPVRPR